jgi:hypothetical protein
VAPWSRDFHGRVAWFGELGTPILATTAGGIGGVRREWIRASGAIILLCRRSSTAITV